MSRLDFLYRTELPHRAVAVYIYLADRVNENGECCHTDYSLRPQALALHRSPRNP